jgi:HAD superfamily hydrolase (TIGR01509 family)
LIKTLVVDLGGVAARFLPERRLEALSSLSGIAPRIIETRIFRSGLDRRSELGMFSPDEVLAAVEAALDHQVSRATLIDAWALAWEPDTDVLECLGSLSIPRAILTNNGPLMDACLERSLQGVKASVSEFICSWHIRACKPDAVAFQRTADLLQSSPQQLLLLDDGAENVKAAIQCGWHADRVLDVGDVIESLGRHELIVGHGL